MQPYEGTICAMCSLCDDEIYEDETYYAINGEHICRNCLAEYARQILAPYAVKGGASSCGENPGKQS